MPLLSLAKITIAFHISDTFISGGKNCTNLYLCVRKLWWLYSCVRALFPCENNYCDKAHRLIETVQYIKVEERVNGYSIRHILRYNEALYCLAKSLFSFTK